MVKKTDSETEYKYDVFISYSSKDKEWVRGELLKRIEEAGLKAFIDFRDFEPGAPSIKECERGVVECRKTLVVLTPDYIASEWGEFESIMVQTLDPANRELRLIPLLKTKCEKPLRIGALTHIDFTDGADLNLAWLQLLTSLGKPPEPEPPEVPERDGWLMAHSYLMPANFTGRENERKMLSEWLDEDKTHPLLSLRALGGFGKSALVWHWLWNDVEPANWPRVVWWSFYESDATFDRFVVRTLDYLSGEKINVTSPSATDIETLIGLLLKPGTLLVLDGFERELRAFGGLDAAYQGDGAKAEENDRDCISLLAENFLRKVATLPNIRSKILLTTRLCPSILTVRGEFLQGCREEVLLQMQPDDAVEYFRARGIRGTDAEIKQVCEPYGYHPLSLSLVAGFVVKNLQQPGDIAVAKELDVSSKQVGQRKHHVLEVAYDSLTLERKALLSRIACFRSPTEYDVLKKLAESAEESILTIDTDLHDLVARGLLHHDTKESRFDLHPIVRRYAYDRLGATDRAAAHTKLRDYFAAVPPRDKVTSLEDLNPVIELYHHTVRAGQFDEACELLYDRLGKVICYQLGAYPLCIDLLSALFLNGESHLSRLKNESAQGWALNQLANCLSAIGQPLRAEPLLQQYITLSEEKGDKMNLAIGLGNLAYNQTLIGAFRRSEASLRRRIVLSQDIDNEFSEAMGRQELGKLAACRGAYAESEKELAMGLHVLEKQAEVQAQGIIWSYRAQRQLLRLRSNPDPVTPPSRSPLKSACRALELVDEDTRTRYPHEGDYVRAHWLLGAAHYVAGQHEQAKRHLHEALERCRRINAVDHEADILIDLARLRVAAGDPDEAKRLAEEALLITERSGYVLQGADAHLELAKLALARGDKAIALDHAQKARDLAYCDGPPDYTYHAAYTEAGALLDELKS